MILPNLYIGNKCDAFSIEFMTERPTVIINCAKEIPKSPFCIDYLHLELEDTHTQKLYPYFPIANAFIDKHITAGTRVLVHCLAGISRSASIVIGYIMYRYNLTWEQAYERVKSNRSIIDPNFGFVCQLYNYSPEPFHPN